MEIHNKRKRLEETKTIGLKKGTSKKHNKINRDLSQMEMQNVTVKTTKERPPDQFIFNCFKTPKDHFLGFRETVISTIINNKATNLEKARNLMKNQNNKNQKGRSKEWDDMFLALQEVELLKDSVNTANMMTRYKLGPFSNRGFNYTDRRKKQVNKIHEEERKKK
jgi:hypothetical protein